MDHRSGSIPLAGNSERGPLIGACKRWLAPVMMLPLALTPAAAAEPRPAGASDLVRRAMAGESGAPGAIEALLDPFFERKDLWTLDEATSQREVLRLLGAGVPRPSILWLALEDGPEMLRLMSIDLAAVAGAAAAGSGGYAAYAVLERSEDGGRAPRVSWYHDVGRKLDEQRGMPWLPLSARYFPPAQQGGPRAIVIEAAPRGSASAAGLLVLEETKGAWAAVRRIAPAGGARLLGLGTEGAVFIADREPPKGVLSGAPAGTFQALTYYSRANGVFASEPVVAPLPDVVTAAEMLIAALRSGDKEGAKRLCVAPDVVETMLYFSPGWKGGGRIVRAGSRVLEIVYEELERPTLRLELTFQNRAGLLLLASAIGRAEGEAGH